MQLQYCTVATEVDVDLIFKLYPDISLWPLYNYRTRPKWLKDVNSNLLYHLTYLLILIELLKWCKSLKDWCEYNVIPYFATTWDTKGLLKVVEERNQLLNPCTKWYKFRHSVLIVSPLVKQDIGQIKILKLLGVPKKKELIFSVPYNEFSDTEKIF